MAPELPIEPDPSDLCAAAEELASAVGAFLLGTSPRFWPPELAAALDAYTRTVGLIWGEQDATRTTICPTCKGRGRVAGRRAQARSTPRLEPGAR